MPSGRLTARLTELLGELEETGRAKAPERAITAIVPAAGEHGPRVRIASGGERPFLRMNSNGYLGMALRPEIIDSRAQRRRILLEFRRARIEPGPDLAHVSLLPVPGACPPFETRLCRSSG